jgi:hypothetical protein
MSSFLMIATMTTLAGFPALTMSQGTVARPMESDTSAAGAHEPDRLYMPALNAIRLNPKFKAKYESNLARIVFAILRSAKSTTTVRSVVA